MSLQTELNTDLPYSRCFSGGGDVAEIDKPVGFQQHGLYFGHDRKLLVDHPYNADKLALLKKLGLSAEPEPAPLAEAQIERMPVSPEIVAELEKRSDEELAEGAAKLVEALNLSEPAPTDRNGLIRFIAQHAS